MTDLSILDFSQLGDPIPAYQFDVMVGDNPCAEVVSIKATSKLLKIDLLPMTKSKLPDLSASAAPCVTVRLYQTLADKDNAGGSFISIRYWLKKLQGVHLELDGATIGTTPIRVAQVYEIERVEFF